MEKYQQSQGDKSITSDLKVPLSTVSNIIKKFITHGPVQISLDVDGEKLMKECKAG